MEDAFLSTDIFTKICLYLNTLEITRNTQVSKYWRSFISKLRTGRVLLTSLNLFPNYNFERDYQNGIYNYNYFNYYYDSYQWKKKYDYNFESHRGPLVKNFIKFEATENVLKFHIDKTTVLSLLSNDKKENPGLNWGYHYLRNKTEEPTTAIIKRLMASYLDFPKMWYIELKTIRNPDTAARKFYTHSLDFYINTLHTIEIQKHFKEWDMLLEIAVSSVEAEVSSFTFPDINIPLKTVIPQKQPLGLIVSMYKYQLDAVSWMKSMEDDTGKRLEYVKLINYKTGQGDLLLDWKLKGIILPKDIEQYKRTVQPKAAILADELGLGKTMEVIALILANPGDPSLVNLKSLQPLDRLIPTNATLILVPSHLVKQWHEEIEKATNHSLNVVVLSGIVDIRTCSYKEIIGADIVIMQVSMLSSANYRALVPQPGSIYDTRVSLSSLLHDVEQWRLAVLQSCGPAAHLFKWKRVVVDEAHQIIDKTKIRGLVTEIPTNFLWYVSATPFPTKNSMLNMLEFIQFGKDKHVSQELAFLNLCSRHLIWRNTKETIKNEYCVPPLVEDLVMLDFTDIETLIYNDCRNHAKDQCSEMICSPAISQFYMKFIGDRPTLHNIRRALIENLQSRITKNKTTIARADKKPKWEEKLAENEARLKTADKNERAATSRKIGKLKKKLETLTKEVNRATENLAHEQKILAKLKKIAESSYTGPDMSAFTVIPDMELDGENQKIEVEEDSTSRFIPYSQILDLSVAQLKDELLKRGIEPKTKLKKQHLQKELKAAVKKAQDEEQQSGDKDSNKRDREEALLAEFEDEEENKKEYKKARISETEIEDKKESSRSENIDSESDNDSGLGEEEYTVEKIVAKRKYRGKLQYKIRWKGYSEKDDSWADEKDCSCPELIAEFEKPKQPKNVEEKKEKEQDNKEKENDKRVKEDNKQVKSNQKKVELNEKNNKVIKVSKVETSQPSKLKKTTQDKLNEQNTLLWLVEKEGTKLANLIIYLQKLWENKPQAKVIIFSQFPKLLNVISVLLEERNVDFSLVEGNSVKRNKRLHEFRSDLRKHVLLLNINQASSGTNITEATHIILMDPIQEDNARAIEKQAIGRAHRQGQTVQVTVVRLIVRDTIEHEAYEKYYGSAS